MWKYSDKVYDHFFNPRNVGELPDADGIGEVGSMACGDALRLSFKLGEDGRIVDARFQTFGCGSAIASSSILTEMVKGKTLEEAAHITNEEIAQALGGLPRQKMHCSVMGREALEAAMIDYYRRQGREVPCDLLTQGILVCNCFHVTRDTIREAILTNNLQTVEDVTYYTKAGGGCEECHPRIEELLAECKAQKGRPAGEEPAGESDRVARIRELLETDVARALQTDGGDIELVGVQGNRVYVRLRGACAACRASDATIKGWVESQLREHVGEELEVVEVKA